MNDKPKYKETRHVVIFGYTHQELSNLLHHFESQLPEYVKITIDHSNLVTKVSLEGVESGIELLRFRMNKYQQQLYSLFKEEVVTTDDKTIAEVLGNILRERDLTVCSAESCTGGNIAHRIVQVPGSSDYFLGSVVSYSNDVKANVLGVSRNDISRFGAVSREVAEQMANGAMKLMRTDCAIATTGIAGPFGGTKFKPVGTVWFAVKLFDEIITDCIRFEGDRDTVIESATNHAMMMLINILRKRYTVREEINDE